MMFQLKIDVLRISMNLMDILTITFLISDFERPHLFEQQVLYTFLIFQCSPYPLVYLPDRNNLSQVHLFFPAKNSTTMNSQTYKYLLTF